MSRFVAMDTAQLQHAIRELEAAKEDVGLLWTSHGPDWVDHVAKAADELAQARRELEKRVGGGSQAPTAT